MSWLGVKGYLVGVIEYVFSWLNLVYSLNIPKKKARPHQLDAVSLLLK